MEIRFNFNIGSLTIPQLGEKPILKDFHFSWDEDATHEELKMLLDKIPYFIETIQANGLEYLKELKKLNKE